MFPANFIIETISSFGWVMMNVAFYLLIFEYTDQIGGDGTAGGAWDKHQFFVFISTSMFINSIVQMFFMTNADEFSELIRTGGLDFALLKPIDTQFLISLRRIEWASLANFVVAAVLMAVRFAACRGVHPHGVAGGAVPDLRCGGSGRAIQPDDRAGGRERVAGRNTSIYDFWFYITTFSRYPMEIYSGPVGGWLRVIFTFVFPILLVVNVPARMLAKPLRPEYAYLALFAVAATTVSLVVSRWVFQRALLSYRSASS